jgi:hypothetical protein
MGLIPLQLDVDLAYLYADLDEEIYVKPPPGVNIPAGYVYRLLKSLYGLKQAGRNWNRLLEDTLLSYGFIRLDEDHCLFILHIGTKVILLFIYVDDIYLAGSSKQILDDFVVFFKSKFKIKLLGVPQQLIGVRLTWGRNFESVHMSVSKHINALLEKFAGQFKSRQVPADPRLKLLKADQLMDTKEVRLSKEQKTMQKQYRSIAGSSIFLVNTCRPDISFATQVLCRSMQSPGYKHWDAAMYLIGYLSSTADLGIEFRRDGNTRPYGYCDADFGADESCRTTSGYLFFLAGAPFSWKSKLLNYIPLSSCESETYAVDSAQPAIREACWIIKVFEEIGHPLLGNEPFDRIKIHNKSVNSETGLCVFEDNQACIQYARNPVRHSTMKHLDRQLKWIQREHSKGTFTLVFVDTEDQLADGQTKALDTNPFWPIVNRFMCLPPSDVHDEDDGEI